jgi:putative membrane protein
MALLFLLPVYSQSCTGRHPLQLRFELDARTSWPVVFLTALFYAFIDIVIDPVALRGDRWFLGQIYGYTYPGVYFGVPLENFLGWAVVGFIALSKYGIVDRKLPPLPTAADANSDVTSTILLGCGLYYGVLAFNLAITFWIQEPLLGVTGLFIYFPITAFFVLRLLNKLPTSHHIPMSVSRT